MSALVMVALLLLVVLLMTVPVPASVTGPLLIV